ncbi:sensor histidine kinase [Marinobacter zhejiangensis]|uniref:histidine kinase n=1 Tax=Marinobacter zhejiangensis TaxID=488535 RepID=A0A1I4QCP2_9GAMM|nr:sensor histidine kinase [Marinobacter zhejiangensis]SFM37807.1 HAMP domain-containing protein [Marinobacter zhejiangensis]
MSGRRRWFPLFWRIFLMIWLAMAGTVVISNLVTRELVERERSGIERQHELRQVGEEAIRIREQEGRGAMRRYLFQQSHELDLRIVLLDDELEERLPDEVRQRMERGWHHQRPAVVEFDNDYRLVAWPRAGEAGWLDPRVFRWVEWGLAVVLVSLACWWVARLIARPLRHMEGTARAIADGDRSLRVGHRIANRMDEIGALATAFNGMTDQLCHLLERQKHLLRDISHDLRTPLMRQRIAIELAADSGADPELMASILRQNERLESMTAQILSLYQVLEQTSEFERAAVKPVALLQEVLADAADYAEHQGVDCHLEASADSAGISVLGDRHFLQRALDNVLQNALDHTPPGKVVHCSVALSGGEVVISITDEGPGVADELLPHLFEPFYRADKARTGQGWGLGLAIAQGIIRSHDGTIAAHNAGKAESHNGELPMSGGDNQGLAVVIRLPVFVAG